MNLLRPKRVRELFDYDPLTGLLRRKVRMGQNAPAGVVVGAVERRNTFPRLRTSVEGVSYFVHRLIWAWVKGRWPRHKIDHRDGDGLNNRWRNLRDATQAINMQNQRKPRSKTNSLPLGVTRASHGSTKFAATIRVGGKNKHLGTFDMPEDAHAAYLVAKRKYHPGFIEVR